MADIAGLMQSLLTTYQLANRDTYARLGGRAPLNMGGLRDYMFGDSSAYLLAKNIGKDPFKWIVDAGNGKRATAINPGGERPLNRTERGETLSQRLRLFTYDVAWLQREIETDTEMTTLAQNGLIEVFFQRLFEVEASIWQEASTNIANDLELRTVAIPHFNDMENRSSEMKDMMSYFAFVNEWFAGLFGILTATGISGGSGGTDFNSAVIGGKWTTKFGVNPWDAKWRTNNINKLVPAQLSYSSASGLNVDGFIMKMIEAVHRTRFPKAPNYVGHETGIDEKGIGADESYWYVSTKGWQVLNAETIGGQDLFVRPSRQDPAVLEPTICGIPVRLWFELDTYAGYNSGSNDALATEGASTVRRGPRAYLHRRSTCFPVAHELNWMRMRDPEPYIRIPDLIGKYVDYEVSWAATDMRRQAVVFPSTTVYGAY